MFTKKQVVSIIDSNWVSIKRNIKIVVIPRATEYIYLDNQYYNVLNVVHTIDKKQNVFIVVEKISTFNSSVMEQLTDNQVIKK